MNKTEKLQLAKYVAEYEYGYRSEEKPDWTIWKARDLLGIFPCVNDVYDEVVRRVKADTIAQRIIFEVCKASTPNWDGEELVDKTVEMDRTAKEGLTSVFLSFDHPDVTLDKLYKLSAKHLFLSAVVHLYVMPNGNVPEEFKKVYDAGHKIGRVVCKESGIVKNEMDIICLDDRLKAIREAK